MVAGRRQHLVGRMLVGQVQSICLAGITPSTLTLAQGSAGGRDPAPASKAGGCSAPWVVGDPSSP
jgi:hypothetical protein